MADTAEKDQPLTPAGRLFLQPQIDQIIYTAITVDFPFSVESFTAELKTSLMVRHPRFCSLLVRDSYGREHWRRTQVDAERHVIVHRRKITDDDDDSDAVNNFIADLTVSSPLPTDKPLWEIHMLLEHRTAVFRLHHALGDGISLVSLLMSCCRCVEDPSRIPNLGGGGGTSTEARPRRRRWWSMWDLVMCVVYTLIHVVQFVARVFWLRDETTVVSGGDGVELWPRRLASAKFRLDDMKTVKGAVAGATINDVLIGIISCGLSRYLDIRSTKALPEGLQLTGLAMVNLRRPLQIQDPTKMINSNSKTHWGNKFGIMLLPVYYQKLVEGSNPIQFVKRAKEMTVKKKISLEALFTYKIGDLVMSLFGAKIATIINYRVVCNTSFTISNIVGPREKIMLNNNPVNSIRATSSSLPHAITMHMVSYAGIAELQILVAKDVIQDPKVLAKLFEKALIEMKEAAVGQFEFK